jgi:two-component system osmolarity sensor histidine kinase EnvZ
MSLRLMVGLLLLAALTVSPLMHLAVGHLLLPEPPGRVISVRGMPPGFALPQPGPSPELKLPPPEQALELAPPPDEPPPPPVRRQRFVGPLGSFWLWPLLTGRSRDLTEFGQRLALVGVLSTALIAVVGFLLMALLLKRPVDRLQALIGDIEVGAAPQAHKIRAPSELREIGNALQKLGQQLHQSFQDRDFMLAALSHDLRTPLTRIRAATDLYELSGKLDVAAVNEDVQHLERMLSQFVDFGRDGSAEPVESVELAAWLQRILAREAQLGVTLGAMAPTHLSVRPKSLAMAVRNLVDNALKHGMAPITVSLGMEADEIVIEVADAGAGFPAEDLPRLLEPFSRGSAARELPGSGLGLAIVDRIAHLHQGRVTVRSRSTRQPFALQLRLPGTR